MAKIKILQQKFGREYFLFLLPVYFVFHGFVEYYSSVFLPDVLRLTFQYLISTIILSLIFFFLFGSWRKTAVFVFTLMAFYFFFGAMHDGAKNSFPQAFFVKYKFILPFASLLFLALFLFLYWSKRNFGKTVRFLNLLLMVCILIDIPFLVKDISNYRQQTPLGSFIVPDSCAKPDIYLIVADEYAGDEELNDIFHFDNSIFETFMEAKGFHIIKNSKSNYNYTAFSVPSILSMNFLSNIKGHTGSSHDLNICYDRINRNDLLNFLKHSKYDIKNYSNFIINNTRSEISEVPAKGSQLISSQTFFSRIQRDIWFNFESQERIKYITGFSKRWNQKVIKELVKESKQTVARPRFIFAHLMMPHYPYYYDSSGKENPFSIITEGNQMRKSEYIQYLKYCNNRFIELINSILNNVKNPPVIIFMGDHGWRHFTEKVDRKYHFMNFCSIYLPDKNYEPFYNGMSNVNMFRTLLNTQFHQHLSLLKDSSSFVNE